MVNATISSAHLMQEIKDKQIKTPPPQKKETEEVKQETKTTDEQPGIRNKVVIKPGKQNYFFKFPSDFSEGQKESFNALIHDAKVNDREVMVDTRIGVYEYNTVSEMIDKKGELAEKEKELKNKEAEGNKDTASEQIKILQNELLDKLSETQKHFETKLEELKSIDDKKKEENKDDDTKGNSEQDKKTVDNKTDTGDRDGNNNSKGDATGGSNESNGTSEGEDKGGTEGGDSKGTEGSTKE